MLKTDLGKDTNGVEPGEREPGWVTVTLWLLPLPLFAVTVSAVGVVLALFFMALASELKNDDFVCLAVACACVSALVALASFIRWRVRRNWEKANSPPEAEPKSQPTEAIVAALVFANSWMQLVVIMQDPMRRAPYKRWISWGVAIIASLYFRLRGYAKLREYFATAKGNVGVTWYQVLVVILVMLATGSYMALMFV